MLMFFTYLFAVIFLIYSVFSLQISGINETISIQESNETFFAYVPLSGDCSYPNDSSIKQGRVDYTEVTPLSIFEAIEVSSQVSFWGAIIDGIRMLMDSSELLQNGTYSQVVLFNSSLESNLTQRQVILVSFTFDGQIVFHYAEPTYNYTSNTLLPTVLSVQNFALGAEIQRMVKDCNRQDSYVRVVYVGNNSFMGLCPNTTNLFAWSTSNNTQPYVYTDLAFLNGDSIQNITNNPSSLFPYTDSNASMPSPPIDWNVVLLNQGGGSSNFCTANLSSLSCDSYQNEQNWI
jgi:hypothetical protein